MVRDFGMYDDLILVVFVLRVLLRYVYDILSRRCSVVLLSSLLRYTWSTLKGRING